MPRVIYTALFVDDPKQLMERISPVFEKTYYHHSTIAYRPENLDNTEVGRKVILKAFGRVTADEIDALLVEGNDKSEKDTPHITLSMPKGIKPNMSKDAIGDAYREDTVELFDEPFEIAVTEGYYNGKKVVTS